MNATRAPALTAAGELCRGPWTLWSRACQAPPGGCRSRSRGRPGPGSASAATSVVLHPGVHLWNPGTCKRSLHPQSAKAPCRKRTPSCGPRIRSLCLALLVLVCAWAGCKGQGETEGVVAWVNGEPVPFSLFWQEFRNRSREAGEDPSPRQEVMLSLKREVLADLVRQRLLLQEAARRGIRVSEEALDARVAELRRGYTGSVFQKTLLEHPQGYKSWRGSVRGLLVLEALYRDVVKAAGVVTEEEIQRAYRENPEGFPVPETVRLKQILVKDRSLAAGLYRRIQKGDDFSELASKYSLSPEKERAGELGIFRRGELPEPLEEAAFSTPVGQVTSPISTTYGFHLLEVEARSPARLASLEEAGGQIAGRILREKQDAFHAQWVRTLVRNSDLRVSEAFRDVLREGEPGNLNPLTDEAKDAQPETP